MPVQTVSTRSDGTGHVALCSCGWEGPVRKDKGDAYHDKSKHHREEHSK